MGAFVERVNEIVEELDASGRLRGAARSSTSASTTTAEAAAFDLGVFEQRLDGSGSQQMADLVRGARGDIRRSLMTRLVVSFLLLSVVTVAVVGVVAYLRARDRSRDSVFDRLEAAAELKADSLDRWVDEQRRNIVFVAGVLGGYRPEPAECRQRRRARPAR